jgi:transcription antitermination protein NusB
MNPARRRISREMAVQMLYQSDLGGSPLPQIFHSFDLAEYLTREELGEKKKDGQEPPTRPSQPPSREDERAEYMRRKRLAEEAFAFAQGLVTGTIDHREQVDALIREQADNWRLERMPPVDRNVLRLAVFEMLYEPDTPKLVIVDEAIELAKKFGSEQSGRFVNGLLDGLLKQHTFPGSLT